MKRTGWYVALFVALMAPAAHAQTLLYDTVTFERAEVLEVLSSETRTIPGTHTPALYQTLKVQLLEGPRAGESLTVNNDYLKLAPGDVFYLRHTVDGQSGRETFAVSEPYRLPAIGWLCALFLVCLFAFGGRQGARGLIALGVSLLCLIYLLLPGVLAGYSPVAVALGVASLIIVVGSYITHGVNRATSAAVLGMLATTGITGALAFAAIHGARLSGYSTEEATYLNFSTQGSIDFVGLLLGALLIGFLGVLYDAAIGQAVAIDELVRAAAHYSRRELVARGLRIGREHIGALVNTLAIAYVGASLPLLLLLTTIPNQSLWVTLNQELFATEVVRILVGSIGIILVVPVTTLIAAYLLHGRKEKSLHSQGEEGPRHHEHTR